jgi:hypothetical protein
VNGQPGPIGSGASFVPDLALAGKAIYATAEYVDGDGTLEAPRSNSALVGLPPPAPDRTAGDQHWAETPAPQTGDADDTPNGPGEDRDEQFSALAAAGALSAPQPEAALSGVGRPLLHGSTVPQAPGPARDIDGLTISAPIAFSYGADASESGPTTATPSLTEQGREHLARLLFTDFTPGEDYAKALDSLRDDIVQEAGDDRMLLGGSIVLSAGASVGYITWLARSGVLLGSVLTAMPAWRLVDPLPILQRLAEDDPNGDDESLQSMVDNQCDEPGADSSESARSATEGGAQHALE